MASSDEFIPSLATCRCIWSLLLLLFRYTTNKFFFFVFFFVRRIQWWWVAEPPLSDYERSVGQRRAMIKPASGDSTGHTRWIIRRLYDGRAVLTVQRVRVLSISVSARMRAISCLSLGRPLPLNDEHRVAPKSCTFSTRHIFGTVLDRMKLILPKCFWSFRE